MNDGNSKLYLADSNGEMQLLDRGKFFPPANGNKTVTNQSMSLQYDDPKNAANNLFKPGIGLGVDDSLDSKNPIFPSIQNHPGDPNSSLSMHNNKFANTNNKKNMHQIYSQSLNRIHKSNLKKQLRGKVGES